jgi:hypothetical protein
VAFIHYLKKITLITLIDLIIVIAFCLVRSNFHIESIGKGMLYMSIIMFFFFVFAITGAGSLSKGDGESYYIRSVSGEDFNKIAGEYSKRSNPKNEKLISLFGSSVLCSLIWLLTSMLM